MGALGVSRALGVLVTSRAFEVLMLFGVLVVGVQGVLGVSGVLVA